MSSHPTPQPALSRERSDASSAWGRPAAQSAYFAIALGLLAAVVAQVFLAGLAVTHDPAYWTAHRALGGAIFYLPVLLAGLAGWARAPRALLVLPLVVGALVWLQHVLLHVPVPAVRALHPTNALAIFAVSTAIAARARKPRAGSALAAALVVALALAGCLGTADAPPEAPELDAEGRYVVEVGSRDGSSRFSPQNAEVPVGATVVWVSEEGGHNVVSEDGGFTSGAPRDRWTFAHTFDEPGVYEYVCEPHAFVGMRGTIAVVAGFAPAA